MARARSRHRVKNKQEEVGTLALSELLLLLLFGWLYKRLLLDTATASVCVRSIPKTFNGALWSLRNFLFFSDSNIFSYVQL